MEGGLLILARPVAAEMRTRRPDTVVQVADVDWK